MDFRHAEQVTGDLRQVSFAVADKPSITEFLTHLQQWRGMFDALEIEAARRLRELSVTAATDIATATQRHIRVGDTVLERAATVAAIASLDAPLKRGALHGAHVDTIAKVARTVNVDANGGKPVIDWGIPIELPPGAHETLFARADAHPVIVANGVVLYAPGNMNLGRSTRLASRAQRRALRGLYATCAIPGCEVRFDHCKPHHVHYWEHGGPTDLNNLVPLCSRHHHRVHDDGWTLTLLPDRNLTVVYPDKTVTTTGPPLRKQAA